MPWTHLLVDHEGPVTTITLNRPEKRNALSQAVMEELVTALEAVEGRVVVLANSGLPHRSATRSFAEGLGWLAQIGLFVLLGLLVDPSDLGSELVSAIVIGLVLLLIARPASVLWLSSVRRASVPASAV